VSIVIDKEKLARVVLDAIRELLPRVALVTRVVRTNESGVYSEPLAGQVSCMSTSPNVICVQQTDGVNYYVRTYYVQTDVDENVVEGDTIVHTHRLKIAPNSEVIIVEVAASEQQ
jgi:hypothetical protein